MTQKSCYKLLLSYDGTAFCGWEKQAQGERTVRGVVEACLKQLTGEEISIIGAGRTDSGVHALGQVASFNLHNNIEENVLYKGLNALFPNDLLCLSALRAPHDYHARYSSIKKTYFYQIIGSRFDDPFRKRYFHRITELPDVEKIREASEILVGEMDFSAMRAAGGDSKTSKRRVLSIKVRGGKDWVRVFFTGDGFLYKMVRNMISLIISQASGAISKRQAIDILASGDRNLAPPTFPGKGLFLWRICY